MSRGLVVWTVLLTALLTYTCGHGVAGETYHPDDVEGQTTDASYNTWVTLVNLMDTPANATILNMETTWNEIVSPDKHTKRISVPLVLRDENYFLDFSVNGTKFELEFNRLNVVSPSILIAIYQTPNQQDPTKLDINYFMQRTFASPPSMSTSGPYDKNYLVSINILPPVVNPLSYWIRSSNCHLCDYQPFQTTTNSFIFDNCVGEKSIKVVNNNPSPTTGVPTIYQQDGLRFGSRGIYSIFYVQQTNRYTTVELISPESDYFPIMLALIYTCLVVLGYLIYKKYYDKIEADEYYSVRKNIQNTSETPDYLVEERVVETDILRGIAIALFILVNSGGGGYIFLNESPWSGIQLGDLPELAIAWVTGFSTPFLIKYKSRVYKTDFSFVKFIMVKSLILIGFGFSYNGNFDLSKFAFTGFFQRLGLGFLIIALTTYWLPMVKHDSEHGEKQFKRVLIRTLILLLLPITHTVLTIVLHESGCPAGYVGPGGIENHGSYASCTGGAARLIDMRVFGQNHIPTAPNCLYIYNCLAFDKYGILGTLNFIFGMYLATLIGEGFIRYKERRRRFIYILTHCLVLMLLLGASFLFADFYSWATINRNLYSIMFVVAGTLFVELFFLLLMYLRTVVKYNGWPFVQIGLNGIAILFMQEICKDILPFGYTNDGQKRDLVICAIMNLSLWTAFALTLHSYKFYIKI